MGSFTYAGRRAVREGCWLVRVDVDEGARCRWAELAQLRETAARGRRPAATAIGEAGGPHLVSHGVRHIVVEPKLRRRPPLEGGVRRTAQNKVDRWPELKRAERAQRRCDRRWASWTTSGSGQ